MIALHNRDSPAHILYRPNSKTAVTVRLLRQGSLLPGRLTGRMPVGTPDTCNLNPAYFFNFEFIIRRQRVDVNPKTTFFVVECLNDRHGYGTITVYFTLRGTDHAVFTHIG